MILVSVTCCSSTMLQPHNRIRGLCFLVGKNRLGQRSEVRSLQPGGFRYCVKICRYETKLPNSSRAVASIFSLTLCPSCKKRKQQKTRTAVEFSHSRAKPPWITWDSPGRALEFVAFPLRPPSEARFRRLRWKRRGRGRFSRQSKWSDCRH